MQIFKFEPIYKETIWGGDKLAKIKGVNSSHLGESWEISSIEGNESVVAEGSDKGLTLSQLIDKYKADLVGEECYIKYGNKFPLLIKFIDAKDDLSIQVHPNDEVAIELEGKSGKTEMWYVLDCDEGTDIIIGHKDNVSKDDLLKCLNDNSILNLLNVVSIKKGDSFYIPAGTIHAIKKGTLIVEVQQSSDITYRLYDYNRKDKCGNLRDLHIKKAIKSININNSSYNAAYNKELCNNYFNVDILDINQLNNYSLFNIHSFNFVICLNGNFTFCCSNKDIFINKGDTLLMGYNSNNINIKGNGQLMIISI